MTGPKVCAILFADLVGSVSLYGRLGDDEAEAVTGNCLTRMQSLLAAPGAKLLEAGGDELLAVFDSAPAAWLAATGMMQVLATVSTTSGKPLSLRIGLHLSQGSLPAEGEIETVARLTGLARGNQILCSSIFSDALADTDLKIASRPELGNIRGSSPAIAVCQLPLYVDRPAPPASPSPPPAGQGAEGFRLRHREQTFLLDARNPTLSIGRDLANQLVIDDRKVSRRHARLERRATGLYLVDTSTNGTFVTLAGQRETMVRRDEIRLVGRGRICFGSSSNDPQANRVDFEPA